jgi:hypothetical protein
MSTVEFMHMLRMEDIEHSSIFHLYALKTANKLFPNNQQISKVRILQVFKIQENFIFSKTTSYISMYS